MPDIVTHIAFALVGAAIAVAALLLSDWNRLRESRPLSNPPSVKESSDDRLQSLPQIVAMSILTNVGCALRKRRDNCYRDLLGEVSITVERAFDPRVERCG